MATVYMLLQQDTHKGTVEILGHEIKSVMKTVTVRDLMWTQKQISEGSSKLFS